MPFKENNVCLPSYWLWTHSMYKLGMQRILCSPSFAKTSMTCGSKKFWGLDLQRSGLWIGDLCLLNEERSSDTIMEWQMEQVVQQHMLSQSKDESF